MADSAARLAELKQELDESIEYRRTHGHEYSPGVTDEIRNAIRHVGQRAREEAES